MKQEPTDMEDFLYKGNLAALGIGLSYGAMTRLANDAIVRHNCDPLSAHLLGRALGAGVLLSAVLGHEERYNIRWQYSGCVKTILIDVGGDGTVRGFISPPNLSDHASSKEEFFGDGVHMSVVRSSRGRVLNSGTVESILHDVVDDLTYYLSISDQVETAMTVLIAFEPDEHHPVRLCRGLMVQAMPDTNLEQFDRVRGELEKETVRSLLAHETEPDSLLENVINRLTRKETGEPGLHYESAAIPRFQCTCSRSKMDRVVRSLSYAERMDILKKGEDLRINCQFCNQQFVLTMEECKEAWTGGEQKDPAR